MFIIAYDKIIRINHSISYKYSKVTKTSQHLLGFGLLAHFASSLFDDNESTDASTEKQHLPNRCM